MTLNALLIHFLKYLVTKKQPASVGEVKSKILGYKNVTIDEVLEALRDKEYINIKENKIQASDSGKRFIEGLDKKELTQIQALVFADYDLSLIEFLYIRNDYVQLHDFPKILKDFAPQHGNSINDGNLLHSLFRLRRYIDQQSDWYVINDIGKAFYENQINVINKAKFPEATAENSSLGNNKRNLPILTLSRVEQLWLTELYNLTKAEKGSRIVNYGQG